MKCTGCGSAEFRYEMATNEDGWVCCHCPEMPGEPPGYCPELDAADTAGKVNDVLMHLADGFGTNVPFVHVSNGSQGDCVTGNVAALCRASGFYDQYYIIGQILVALGSDQHSKFWKEIGDGVRSGDDVRDRCACGELAVTSSSSGSHRCGSCAWGVGDKDGSGGALQERAMP